MDRPTFPPTFKRFDYSSKSFKYEATCVTHEEAVSWAASFPKSCRVRGVVLMGCDYAKGLVVFQVLGAETNAGMGEVNEAGEARLRSFLRNAKKLGLRIAPHTPTIDHP